MDRPREVDIEQEFTSPHDGRLVFHISQDFELGDGGNYGIVKSFIERRKTMPIKDQLHAVWLCFRIPVTTLGERLLGDAEKTLLSVRREVLGDTPTIIVFTQYDRLMTCMPKNIPDDPEAERRYLQEHCIQPIQAITGDMDIAHVAVSTKPSYERRLQDLISVTRERVSKTLTLRENQVLPVPLTWAQSSTSKVGLSVDVGRQRYWMLLRASANFPRYTMQDCLRVIHTDIVSVWNFYDPFDYLNSEDFRKMMMNIVNSVDSQPPSDINRSVSFVVLIPMTLIFATGKWAYRTYGRLKAVPRKFMAYIVNLTHVMAILFSLTARMKAKMLTRTAIELVWKAYEESEWMKRTHKDICFFGGRGTACGAVLKEVESMILSGDREIEVSRALKWVSPVDLATDGKC
ncbi:hypothetical protein EDC04DRAFT_2890601 [Pisolithus marmoratus]|nr:hypothetical protein EDC04DRAFT_2890601 [Pisolithus marmoratus]